MQDQEDTEISHDQQSQPEDDDQEDAQDQDLDEDEQPEDDDQEDNGEDGQPVNVVLQGEDKEGPSSPSVRNLESNERDDQN